MKLKFLLFFFIILNLASVNALLNPTFESCSDSYYKKLWETIHKEPYEGQIKPSIYHEGPDHNGKCSNFDLNLTKETNGYKDVYYVALAVNPNRNTRGGFAGYFRVSDPEGTWQLPSDFLERFLTYASSASLSSDTANRDPDKILITNSDAKQEYENYLKGITPLNKWEAPQTVSGEFTYSEVSDSREETIIVSKRKKATIYILKDTLSIESQPSLPEGSACTHGDKRQCNLPGICSLGTQTCIKGIWSDCSVGPRKEVCFDRLDNDCDGIIDENCLCKEAENRTCGIGIGICNLGTQTCSNGTWAEECVGAIQPLNETCNNLLDDDCDGLTDLEDSDCIVPQQTPVCNNNNIKDDDEEGIDCGGPCPACPSCSDGTLNQGEVKTGKIIDAQGAVSDCGGPNCPTCPTCNDNIQNQNEEGVDCGGLCSTKCEELRDTDGDGITDAREIQIGTSPFLRDTDGDDIDDLEDVMPLCPNNYCDENFNENSDNCPQDCGSIPIFPIVVIFFIFIPLIGFLLYFLIKKKRGKNKKQTFKIHSSFLKQKPTKTSSDELTEKLKKIK